MKSTKGKDSSTKKSNGIDNLVPNNPNYDLQYKSSDDKIDAVTRNHMLYDTWNNLYTL